MFIEEKRRKVKKKITNKGIQKGETSYYYYYGKLLRTIKARDNIQNIIIINKLSIKMKHLKFKKLFGGKRTYLFKDYKWCR